MNKKYTGYLLKQWIPLIINSFVPIFLISLFKIIINDAKYCNDALFSSLTFVCFAIFFLTLLYPLFVESYRLKKVNADCYYSLPFKNNGLRMQRTITALLIIIAISFLCYFVPIGVYYLKIATFVPSEDEQLMQNTINFGNLVLLYLIFLIFVCTSYFISCFLVKLGNSYATSFLILIAGVIVLSGLIPSIVAYLTLIIDDYNFSSKMLFMYYQSYGYSPFFILFFDTYADFLIDGVVPQYSFIYNGGELASFIVSVVITLALGILSIIDLIKEKEPSGEYSGSVGSHKKYSNYIIATAFLCLGILISILGTLWIFGIIIEFLSYFIVLVVLTTIEYVVYLMYFKKTGLNKFSWISIGVVDGVSFILYLTNIISFAVRNK